LGHAAAERGGVGEGDRGGGKVNLKPIHRRDAEGAEYVGSIFFALRALCCEYFGGN